MKHVTVVLLFIALQFCMFNIHASNQLHQKAKNEQYNFPKGDIHDMEYVHNILQIMYQMDQDIKSEYVIGVYNEQLLQLEACVNMFHCVKMREIFRAHALNKICVDSTDDMYKRWLFRYRVKSDHYR